MYQSIGWNAPAGLRWQRAPVGYRLAFGWNARAVIVPTLPRRWNGFSRWTVDAIGLRGAVNVRTLADARALAEGNA